MQLNKNVLGVFHCKDPIIDKKFVSLRTKNILIEGHFSTIRRHMSGVLLEMQRRRETHRAFDAYQLVDVFFGKDDEMTNFAPLVDPDLSIILLGFTEIVNRILPDMILQVMTRRDLRHRSTWVILGIPKGQVETRFGLAMARRLDDFIPVEIKD